MVGRRDGAGGESLSTRSLLDPLDGGVGGRPTGPGDRLFAAKRADRRPEVPRAELPRSTPTTADRVVCLGGGGAIGCGSLVEVGGRAWRHRNTGGAGHAAGTVTLVFTDIEGSTSLLQALGDRYPEILAGHHRLIREAFARHGAMERGSAGDGLYFVFPAARSRSVSTRDTVPRRTTRVASVPRH